MSSYTELQSQIAALQQEAEAARRSELQGAIEKIRTLMTTYGITVADLETANKKPRVKNGPVAAKYRDPVSGASWTGRGRAPLWLNGRSKEDFRID